MSTIFSQPTPETPEEALERLRDLGAGVQALFDAGATHVSIQDPDGPNGVLTSAYRFEPGRGRERRCTRCGYGEASTAAGSLVVCLGRFHEVDPVTPRDAVTTRVYPTTADAHHGQHGTEAFAAAERRTHLRAVQVEAVAVALFAWGYDLTAAVAAQRWPLATERCRSDYREQAERGMAAAESCGPVGS